MFRYDSTKKKKKTKIITIITNNFCKLIRIIQLEIRCN